MNFKKELTVLLRKHFLLNIFWVYFVSVFSHYLIHTKEGTGGTGTERIVE